MIRLRALKGQMGNTNYYLTTATFGEVARMVRYKENDRDWPPELRQQRPLNMSRVRKTKTTSTALWSSSTFAPARRSTRSNSSPTKMILTLAG